MPQYDYVCANCEHGFTEIISMKDYDKRGPKKKCLECGKFKLERMMSSYSFKLQGQGGKPRLSIK